MVETRSCGRTVSMKVELYSECKYTASEEVFKNAIVVEYDDVVYWDIVTGDEATALGLETDENSRDEHNEYLVLHFEDGSEATFRNSYVDMFRNYNK